MSECQHVTLYELKCVSLVVTGPMMVSKFDGPVKGNISILFEFRKYVAILIFCGIFVRPIEFEFFVPYQCLMSE